VCAGGAAALAPFALYFAAAGALGEALRQVVLDSLERGGAALAGGSFAGRLARLARAVEWACPEQQWLFAASFLGFAPLLAWWRRGPPERRRLLLPLLVVHAGLALFSLLDFQRYGDLLALLQTSGFLLGALWAGLYVAARGRVAAAGGARGAALAASALLAAVALARPAALRPRLAPRHLLAAPEVTLEDQRAVARAFDAAVGAEPVALLDHAELLVLAGRRNALPLVFWNHAAWVHFRASDAESPQQTVARLLREADAAAVAWPPEVPRDARALAPFRAVSLASPGGAYRVEVALRVRGDRGR
jgi:hypothetical protein